MKKIYLVWIISVVVVLLVVGLIGLFYLGTIVKLGIEKFGPQITKVSVNVGIVTVSPFSGGASINGLVVGNPQGYKSPQAINVGNVSISLDPRSLTSSKILVHSVRVNSPEITFEQGLGLNNLSRILSNVNSSAQNPNAPGNGGNSSSGKPASTIEIDDFVITGAKVNVSISGIVSQVIPLPEIHLTNLGKDGNGLTPVELTREILKSLLTDTLKAVASAPGTIGQTIGSVGSSVSSSLGSLFGK